MSLLLKMREWIGLDEAVDLARNAGIFPNIRAIHALRRDEYLDIRSQIIHAYMEKGSPLRLVSRNKPFYIYVPFEASSGYPSFAKSTGTYDGVAWKCLAGHIKRSPISILSIKYTYAEDSTGVESLWVEDPFDKEKPSSTAVYFCYGFPYQNEFQILYWNNIVYRPNHEDRNIVEVKRDVLDAIISKAKSLAPPVNDLGDSGYFCNFDDFDEIPSPATPNDQPLDPRSERSYQTIIGAMLELLVGDDKPYPKQAALIAELERQNKYGMSESTLNVKFAECRKVYKGS